METVAQYTKTVCFIQLLFLEILVFVLKLGIKCWMEAEWNNSTSKIVILICLIQNSLISPLPLAVSQVEHWLENLHDRRRLLEIAWQNRKSHLEQCLALALLASDLKGLEEMLVVGKEALARCCDHLGNSPASAELLLHEHKKLFPEAKVNGVIAFSPLLLWGGGCCLLRAGEWVVSSVVTALAPSSL